MKPIIEVNNFTKSFGKSKVVKNLSFKVFPGDIFAFIGANGSGKTTTLRTLLGIYSPDEGELLINGRKYSQDDASTLGYLPEERGLYTNSTVIETLEYFGIIKGMTKQAAHEEAMNFLQIIELSDKAKTEVKKLSSGQQQKIQLGITIINKPSLLVLDEPTKGLDPVNRHFMLQYLLKMRDSGGTIIFSTHQMEEAEEIANRMLMIKNGRSVLYGHVDKVKAKFNNMKLNDIFIKVSEDEKY